MKICHIVCGLQNGGVETVLLNYYSRMDCSDDELHLITYDNIEPSCMSRFQSLGFHIHIIPPKRDGFFRSNHCMRKELNSLHFDIIHTHLTEWNCIPLYYAWRCGVRRRIHHVHTTEGPNNFAKRVIFSLRNIFAKHFSTDFVACSQAAAILWFGKRAVEKNKVLILANGIDIPRFTPNKYVRMEVRREWGVQNSLCVGHVGRFAAQKNHMFLLDVFKQILCIAPDSKLILCGDGPLNNEIHEKVRNLGMEQDVIFLGVRQDIERIYQGFDVFLLPSISEGFPIVALEAQAAGLPCCLSDGVTNEAVLSQLCITVPLRAAAERWAKEALLMAQKRSFSPNVGEVVKSAGFSITDNVHVLTDLYSTINKSNNTGQY